MKCVQFQRLVSEYFYWQAIVIARCPLPFVLAPTAIAVWLGYEFAKQGGVDTATKNGGGNNDALNLFMPEKMEAVAALKTLVHYFPPRDALRDNYDMFAAAFAYVVIVDNTEEQNVLRDYSLLVANDLNTRIQDLRVPFKHSTLNWRDVCYRDGDECLLHPALQLLNTTRPMSSLQYFVGYPFQLYGSKSIDNALTFGGVTTVANVDGMPRMVSARAMRLAYFLRMSSDPDEMAALAAWQNGFIELVSRLHYDGVNLYYTSAISWAKEVERNGALILPFMPLLFIMLFLFSVCSCLSGDCQVTVRLSHSDNAVHIFRGSSLCIAGILNAIFAVVSALGTLIAVGYPFMHMVFIMPFLIMSISIDNMFLILNAWHSMPCALSVETRVSRTIGDTAVSILITSLTDGLSFSIGSVSTFPAVRIFCTYCALACLYVFLYQMTFFVACLVLAGRREAANRHCITMRVVKTRQECLGESVPYRLFCAGGTDRKAAKLYAVDEGIFVRFFDNVYAEVLNNVGMKVIVLCTYAIYVTAAIYSLLQLHVGLELHTLVPADSYLIDELHSATEYFSAYGAYAYAVTEGTNIRYDQEPTKRHLLTLYHNLSSTTYTAPGQFWLEAMDEYYQGLRFRSRQNFMEALRGFLSLPEYAKYASDIALSDEPSTKGAIVASKMLIRMRNVGYINHTAIAYTLRATFAMGNVNGFVYESTFVLVDQQATTVNDVVHNVAFAVVTMLVIALLFMPKFLTALWIGLSILSINVGVIGGLALWDVNLDIVSMITVVMSIGFSVDFVAHITYHYLIVRGSERRLNKALRVVGYPIMQAAASTAVGVMTLAPVDSYMVRTFVKTVILVVGLGVLHGLLFLPVFLSLLVPAASYLDSLHTYQALGNYLATKFPRTLGGSSNTRMQAYKGRDDNNTPPSPIDIESSHRTVVGGLHARAHARAMSPLAATTRHDLYDFLKGKCVELHNQNDLAYFEHEKQRFEHDREPSHRSYGSSGNANPSRPLVEHHYASRAIPKQAHGHGSDESGANALPPPPRLATRRRPRSWSSHSSSDHLSAPVLPPRLTVETVRIPLGDQRRFSMADTSLQLHQALEQAAEQRALAASLGSGAHTAPMTFLPVAPVLPPHRGETPPPLLIARTEKL